MVDRLSLSFPREPDSVPAARAALTRFEGSLSQSALYDASLCLSELVTNAVQHPAEESGTELGLELSLSAEALRVEVIDPGRGFVPPSVTPSLYQTSGWGLYFVGRSALRLGTLLNGSLENFLLITFLSGTPVMILLLAWSVHYSLRKLS